MTNADLTVSSGITPKSSVSSRSRTGGSAERKGCEQ
jgi:hypothetical protein